MLVSFSIPVFISVVNVVAGLIDKLLDVRRDAMDVFLSSNNKMSSFIKQFTRYHFSHVAISETPNLEKMYSFARKMGQAVAAGVSGWLLTAIGYVPGAAGGQTQAVLSGIFAVATLVPALGFVLLAAVLWWWYPLHKARVESNTALLHEKHEKELPDD